MKKALYSSALIALLAAPAVAAPEAYTLDSSHSQVVFSYNHLGYSTTYGVFAGFEGEIMFDQESPENSSVSVSMPTKSMFTGWEQRTEHFMSEDFFGATDEDMITFTSTSIEVTGEDTANITGDLTMNGITKSVVLDAKLNQAANHPMLEKPWAGFDATTTLLRSDFEVGAFAPFVGDEVNVMISIEAEKAE
ncbi:Polyisoprenoid-binding protein YceI [Cognatiyoonia koreensis]|uniref:Polyisoprenoid-binding protein YceI n=1 Tax=Cognatiyoonia koreensis TaxID=364200 RepID=A0A1I0NRD6_9RHOB|nr:YceI family protein [Cognatiyoonia koreensis]SEW03996.1 Polyisoprenoid-binding protein YceI [Cognatiyoonia koreensis]